MIKLELLQTYTVLDSHAKTRFLAILSHKLTIFVREKYDESVDCDVRVKRLMGSNELQHHISSELSHHLEGNADRYPDEVLINILLEKAHYYEISSELQQALVATVKRLQEQ